MPAVLARPATKKWRVAARCGCCAICVATGEPGAGGQVGRGCGGDGGRPPGGGAGTGHQQPVAAGRSARGSAAERAQGTSSPQRRSCCAQRRAAGQTAEGGAPRRAGPRAPHTAADAGWAPHWRPRVGAGAPRPPRLQDAAPRIRRTSMRPGGLQGLQPCRVYGSFSFLGVSTGEKSVLSSCSY